MRRPLPRGSSMPWSALIHPAFASSPLLMRVRRFYDGRIHGKRAEAVVEFACPSCGCRAVIVSDSFVRLHRTAGGEPCSFVRTAHSGSPSIRQKRGGNSDTRQRSVPLDRPTPDVTRRRKKRGLEDPARVVGQRLDAEVKARSVSLPSVWSRGWHDQPRRVLGRVSLLA